MSPKDSDSCDGGVCECQVEADKSELTRLQSESDSLRTELATERTERGKTESSMARRNEELATVREDLKQTLTAVREDLKQALENASTKDFVVRDLNQQMALLQREVW